MNTIKLLGSSFFKYISLAILLLTVNSCRVTLVSQQDSELLKQIDATTQTIDAFYLKMLESTARDYAKYADNYIAIEVQLNAIYNKNRLKADNAETTKIADNVRKIWTKYKGEHKIANTLNDAEITYNNSTIGDILFTLSVAENAKPK